METEILQAWINNAKNIVFFGGAGVSTESGIPDFRSKDGLYNQKYDFPPETILSHNFFINNTDDFYKFYREKMDARKVDPNIIHTYLAQLEQIKNLTIVTQNIDGLHQKAGSKKVLELHGSIYHNHCMNCHLEYPCDTVFEAKTPICSCGGLIKPDVVLYDESLNESVTNQAIYCISTCDLLIIAGTSLSVYPAASFIHYFQGKHLVIINQDNTNYDHTADLVIHDKLGNIFKNLKP